jgi:hypothetical protein
MVHPPKEQMLRNMRTKMCTVRAQMTTTRMKMTSVSLIGWNETLASFLYYVTEDVVQW